MKRLTTILLTIAICVGVFAPAFGVSTAYAQSATNTTPTAGTNGSGTNTSNAVQLAADPSTQIASCTDWSGLHLGPCIARLAYYIPFDIGEWFMGVAARTFDIAASFTLSSKLYTAGTFLQEGWQVTRDFANIFFILILLFIALSMVLDIEVGHANPKKMLATLIMVALVINFSFFITEVVIDISNSLALVFYNQVTVVARASNGSTVNIDDGALNTQIQNAQGTDAQGHSVQYIQTEKPLSIALVQAMKPQVISDPAFYAKLCTDSFYAPPSGKPCDPDKSNNSGTLIALFVLVGIMYIIVGYCFVVALGSLFGRMISLFIAIIFAPLAFVSLIVPNMAHKPGFGWDEWFGNLMTNAFAAPIFFFFILLISILSKSSIIPDSGGLAKLSAGVILLLVTIQFLILITMLLAAVKYVKSASGAIGSMMGGLAGTLVKGLGGLAVGTVAGGAALAGQSVIGGAAAKLSKSKLFTRMALTDTTGKKPLAKFGGEMQRIIGERAIKLGKAGSNASFDVRHNAAANALSSATGMNFGSFSALSAQRTAGGFVADVAYKQKRDLDFANSLRKNQAEEDSLKAVLKAKKDQLAPKEDIVEKRKADLKEFEEKELKPLEGALKKAEKDLDITLKNRFATEDQIKAAKDTYEKARDAVKDKKDEVPADPEKKSYTVMEKDLKKAEADVQTIQRGQRKGDGKQKTYTQDDFDNKVKKANGRIVTQNDVGKSVVKESLGIKDIEDLIASNEKANSKAFLYLRAKDSGYHTTPELDKLGNVKGYHVDSSNYHGPQLARLLARSLTNGGVAGLLAAPIVAPLTAVYTAGAASIVTALREGFGSSYAQAEAAHHNAAPHDAGGHGGGHDHGKGTYHPPGGGILSELTKLFGAAAGGGGGGGHGGGGGGGHH